MSEVVESSAQEVRLGDEKEEEKLRAQQAEQQDGLKFKTVFENVNDCMFVLDMSGRILDVNKKAVTLFGRTKEELYGRHFSRVNAVSPKDVPRLVSGLAEVFAGKKSSLLLNVRSKMGREIALDCSGSLMKVGDKLSVLVIARDISERQRMEEALKASEERHRNLFELAPDGILTSDLKGNVTSVNEAFLRITGFSREEIVGKHFTRLPTIREIDMPNYVKLFFSYLRGKRGGPIEFTYCRKDGTLAWGDAHPAVLKEKGKVTGFQVVLRDITERKKAEAKVKESQHKFERLFMGVPEAAVYVDPHDRVLDVNPRFTELFGYSLDESRGKTLDDLIVPMEKKKEAIELTEKSKKGHVYVETIRKTKNGSLIPVSLSGSPLVVEGQHIGDVLLYRDITERKFAEDALRKSESKYRTLLENVPQKIFFKDRNSVYVSCNENYARDLKIKSDEITSKTDYDFYPRELAEKYRADDKRIMDSGKTEDIEEGYIQDGQKAFVHTVKTPVKDENGNVVGILGIFWDITEQKKAEEKIRESEEKYRVLVESAADSIFMIDETGNFISANREAANAIGKTPKDMIGKSMYDLFPKHIAELQMRGINAVFQTGNPIIANEALTQTKFGKRWFNTTIMPITNSNGKIICVMGIARDVTERKEMEEKLRQYSEHLEELFQKRTAELLESEKRYSVLVEEASDGVVMIQDGKTIFANKKALKIIGYSKDELINLPPEKVIDQKYLSFVKEGHDRTIKGEIDPSASEAELITKTGERVPVEGSPALINYQGRPAVIIIWRDITERKRLEEQRLRLEKLAAIGELATMVGHDLRNPLQSIENATYYLNNELTDLSTSVPISQKTTEMLQVINDSINYADKIIRDLQDFSATKAPALKETDVNTLVTETLSQAQTPKNIELHTELGYLPEIKADKDQIKRVFLNLTTNAIQAMEKGGTLTISTKKTESWIEVNFKDTGVGISKENIKKIFTPFFTTRAKGMGMGLSICKKFIEMHDGSIQVESEVGKGTTFTVKLPIHQESGGEKT